MIDPYQLRRITADQIARFKVQLTLSFVDAVHCIKRN